MKALLFLSFLMSMLAGCYHHQDDLQAGIRYFRSQDYSRAFRHLVHEADKGQKDAQYALGFMYYYGQGVVEDRTEAWYWITKAAQAGQPDAQKALKLLNCTLTSPKVMI